MNVISGTPLFLWFSPESGVFTWVNHCWGLDSDYKLVGRVQTEKRMGCLMRKYLWCVSYLASMRLDREREWVWTSIFNLKRFSPPDTFYFNWIFPSISPWNKSSSKGHLVRHMSSSTKGQRAIDQGLIALATDGNWVSCSLFAIVNFWKERLSL